MHLVKYYCPVNVYQADTNRWHAVEHMTKWALVYIVGLKLCGPNRVDLTEFTLEWIPSISKMRRIPGLKNVLSQVV
jgi:hypothetical protein